MISQDRADDLFTEVPGGYYVFKDEEGPEVTHLHCGICESTFLIEELALNLDGRRECDACVKYLEELAEIRRFLEDEGQQRLFSLPEDQQLP